MLAGVVIVLLVAAIGLAFVLLGLYGFGAVLVALEDFLGWARISPPVAFWIVAIGAVGAWFIYQGIIERGMTGGVGVGFGLLAWGLSVALIVISRRF